MEFTRVFSRRAGADMGIPNMISKKFAGSLRIKAATTTTQSDSSP
jgi:hypothetical protein